MAKYGVRCEPAVNDRLGGRSVLKEAMARMVDGPPGFVVFSTFPNLIRTAPSMVHDRVRVEDLDTSADDHALDAVRYGSVELLGCGPRTRPKAAGKRSDILAGSGYAGL